MQAQKDFAQVPGQQRGSQHRSIAIIKSNLLAGELSMAQHKVSVKLPRFPLRKADATFDVESDGEKFGTLKVSVGSVVWFPYLSRHGVKMSWEKFGKLMEENVTRYEKR